MKVLKSRYGVGNVGPLLIGARSSFYNVSAWWKSIGLVGRFRGSVDWVGKGLRRKVARGEKTDFWEDVWVGENSFKELFPCLFQISSQKKYAYKSVG